MRLENGQTWQNTRGTRRTIVDARGSGIDYYSGVNESKTSTVSRFVFQRWVINTNARKLPEIRTEEKVA